MIYKSTNKLADKISRTQSPRLFAMATCSFRDSVSVLVSTKPRKLRLPWQKTRESNAKQASRQRDEAKCFCFALQAD